MLTWMCYFVTLEANLGRTSLAAADWLGNEAAIFLSLWFQTQLLWSQVLILNEDRCFSQGSKKLFISSEQA